MTGFFPEPPLFAAARRTDPRTSHAAAARAPVSEQGHASSRPWRPGRRGRAGSPSGRG